LPRLYAPDGTMHVVARCNNREFYFTATEEFEILLDHLGEMSSAYGVGLFAYTLMSSHIHLLMQAPAADVLGRPLRWFMTQTAKVFHRIRNRSGHFWERRFRACLVEDDLYALAALRYMDRNPVRAGIVEDPAAYAWSSCARYALGAANGLIQLHPSYLGLSTYAKAKYGRNIIVQFLPPAPIRSSMVGISGGRASVLSAEPRSYAAIMRPAGDKASFLCLNKFEGLDNQRCRVPSPGIECLGPDR
jgi:putative transposase